jgi:ribonuclease P protein subunit RPR2
MKKEVRKIAQERIKRLFELAWQNFKKKPYLARRYVKLARLIGLRYNVRLSKELKRSFCKKCNSLLVPGITAKVRLCRGKIILITCLFCGKVKRYPYRKESFKRKVVKR